jgi:folate-binding protein YgfZ
MRSAVVIDVQSRMACGALCDAAFLRANDLAPHATVNACRSNRKVSVICTSPSLPLYEIVGDDAALKALEAPFLEDTNWAEALIRAGCVRVDASAAETFTPHMLSLDLAGAISFSKGCYTGQEIIARTEHRGRSRRRLRRYIAERAGIAAGEALYAGDDTIGTVVNVAGTQLLGIVVDNAEPGPVRAGTIPLDLAALPWE